MKITFLVPGSIRSNFVYRTLAFARALKKQGNDVSIIAPRADKYNNFNPEKMSVIDGIRVLQPFQFTTKRIEINFLPYLFGAIRMALKEKADLIYIYKPTPINIVGFVVKLFRAVPVAVDLDDLGSEVMRIEGHPSYQRKLVQWSEQFAVKHANYLIVASTYLFEKYHKEFPDKPIYVMPNGVEADWFTPPVLSDEKKRVVFMGSINRRSILEPLFEVAPEIIRQFPDTKILIIGEGKDKEYFKQKTSDLNISSSVTFTGWLDLNEARARLRAGDIGYCYMPDEETVKAASNMKVSQYMSRGVVPLVSDVGDLPSIVDFGKAGYICEGDDTEALKSVLREIFMNDDMRSEKAHRAPLFVAEKFNWDTFASGFLQWSNSG